MALKGPAPTPKSELEQRGSWLAKDRPAELELAPGMPKPSAKLNKQEAKDWEFYVGLLFPRRALAEGDGAALTMFVKLLDQERRLEAAEKKTVMGSVDWKRLYTARSDARKHLKDMFARFGLTPADRPRVKLLDNAKPTDGKERFFKPKLVS